LKQADYPPGDPQVTLDLLIEVLGNQKAGGRG
jgi:hypothetical protein